MIYCEVSHWILLSMLLVLISGQIVEGDNLNRDKEILLKLKGFIESNSKINTNWNESDSSPCRWRGITCNDTGSERVIGITLRKWGISGEMFSEFSQLTYLSVLDLSNNKIKGQVPFDLNHCKNLRVLNLSHNALVGKLNLTGLVNLQVLDVTLNRLSGGIRSSFSCENLISLNLSSNSFSGSITDNVFDGCEKLNFLDLSSNKFVGTLWEGFTGLKEFSLSENNLTGELSSSFFVNRNCSLEILDLSENNFIGTIVNEISYCRNLISLDLRGNNFIDKIPPNIGKLDRLEFLFLGGNNLSREIPESLLNCRNLIFLDLSKNGFGGNIQEIFGRFTQIKFLNLYGNSYTGGIESSKILKLSKLYRLDLSFNKFSGPLPIEIFHMANLKFLVLAFNQFSGNIPFEVGQLKSLQALDLSFNNLTGPIPRSIGNLNSLLWLMLANNFLTGEIPSEIGNCSSLLWLNLANNQLTGRIPQEIYRIGENPDPTFISNRNSIEHFTAGSGGCQTMKRWIPADYPPFSFVYNLLTIKSCRNIWDRILKGYGLYRVCPSSPEFKDLVNSGYLQLTNNRFDGELSPEIGRMNKFSLVHLGLNNFSGRIPPEISRIPLTVFNISHNLFSGEIPRQIGNIKCLENLDLSINNFSGNFPESLTQLSSLNKFNISYNPLLTGTVPETGQMNTFENDSFLGIPNLLIRRKYVPVPPMNSNKPTIFPKVKHRSLAVTVFLSFFSSLVLIAILSVVLLFSVRKSLASVIIPTSFTSSDEQKQQALLDTVSVFQLNRTKFTYTDILHATRTFSDDMIIGTGGFATVYRGVLPDGRQIAVKKLRRNGPGGEREFQAEMEVLNRGGGVWPHPNLVELYGWCLYGSEKMLVYEFVEGGNLEEVIEDWNIFDWRRRLDTAIDVARALVFLHHVCNPAVVHRDVKASNVLLDREGQARVTDFGLSRVVACDETHVSTMIAGTVGYVPPEYSQTWRATTKGDVYSYGVLLMELATGRRAVDGGEESLLDWARRESNHGKEIFKKLVLHWRRQEEEETLCELLRIAVLCTMEIPHERPNMKEVLTMLLKLSSSSS